MTVRWTHGAAKDLESIADYLHRNAPSVAPDILRDLYERTMALGQSPFLGRLDDGGRNRRLFLADHYLLTYRIDQDAVHVLRIRHTSRKPLKP